MHGADRHALPGNLDADRQRHAFVGLHVHDQDVRLQTFGGELLERRVRCTLELNRDRRLASRKPLAGSEVEGRVGPAPVVHVELRRDIGLGHRVRIDVLLFAIAGDLFALDVAAPVLPAHH